ncbi:MAG: hypothetical protein EXQ86_05580 [Rhodospirillales bacterium]|nr:hypothetical protein [Rhodospirillales bacterium]
MNAPRIRPLPLLLLLAALAACETATSSATPSDFVKWGLEQGLRNACASSGRCSNRNPETWP